MKCNTGKKQAGMNLPYFLSPLPPGMQKLIFHVALLYEIMALAYYHARARSYACVPDHHLPLVSNAQPRTV